jgi:hypothetical protein
MKKVLGLLIFLFGALFAQEAKWHPNDLIGISTKPDDPNLERTAGFLVGIEAGYERVWGNYGFLGEAIGYNTVNYGVKIGYALKGDNRIYLSYSRNTDMEDKEGSYTSTTTLQKVSLGLEGIYPASSNFGIIAGGLLGWAKGDTDDSDGDSYSESAFAVGVKVGGIINIGTHNEIEFGIKAGGSFFEETAWNAGAYVGYNFKL